MTNKWYQRSAFAALWKSITGFAVLALTGTETWKAAGTSAAVALLMSSWDIFFGTPSQPVPPEPEDPDAP